MKPQEIDYQELSNIDYACKTDWLPEHRLDEPSLTDEVIKLLNEDK